MNPKEEEEAYEALSQDQKIIFCNTHNRPTNPDTRKDDQDDVDELGNK
jgi:hypothetical protein